MARAARAVRSDAVAALVVAAILVVALAGCRGDRRGLPIVEPAVAGGDPRPPWEQIDRPSLAACGVCHLDVYGEWETSLHHRAWTNANVRDETNDFAQSGCRPCHSPQPVLVTGLDRRPDYRDFNQPDGVHCLSCHGLSGSDGGVAASRTLPDAPCRPRFDPGFVSANSCWPCHEPTHHAYEEYDRSDAKAVGLRCADCHMQTVARGADRAGRSHGPNGGLNPDFVRRAVAWQCELEGGELVVALRNRTGHKFPGEIPSRLFQVRVTVDGGEPRYVTLSKPRKDETRADDRLDVDETRALRFTVDAAASDVQVALLFKPFPLLPDEAAFVLGEWRSGEARAR